jgi:hypothetical protein
MDADHHPVRIWPPDYRLKIPREQITCGYFSVSDGSVKSVSDRQGDMSNGNAAFKL